MQTIKYLVIKSNVVCVTLDGFLRKTFLPVSKISLFFLYSTLGKNTKDLNLYEYGEQGYMLLFLNRLFFSQKWKILLFFVL